MTVPHALLAALAQGERYGYQLRRDLEHELGPSWRLDLGQIYRALRVLANKNWVSVRRAPGLCGPPRKLYRLTPAGRTELRRWLEQPQERPAPAREAFAVRRHYSTTASSPHPRTGRNGLVSVGSDDLVLDLIARYLGARSPSAFQLRTVGSIAGLLALRDGHADVAGIHLLDIDTGEYNVPFLKHLLPEERIVLVEIARREQGLLLAPGNPRRIRRVGDLARPGLRLINRQRGAGTRLLLFQKLKHSGIDPQRIVGYDVETPTHAAVAAAVAAGRADAGPGVRAAAQAWGLDFLPLASERYELAIPQRVFDSPRSRPLLDALHARSLRQAAAQLVGYDVTRLGSITARVN